MSDKSDFIEFEFTGSGLTTPEKNWGKKRFAQYRQNYPHLHKMSDLQLLEELVFQEALHERVKEKIGSITKTKKVEESSEVPKFLQESLRDGLDLQFKLKEKLGLFEDKKKLDVFQDFQDMMNKAREYRRTHPDLFKVTCVHCAKYFFLKRRTDAYETFKSPLFKDKVLCNPVLWDWYKSGKINKDEYADALGVSPDYIDWLKDHIFEIPEKKPVDTSAPSETDTPPAEDSSEKTPEA